MFSITSGELVYRLAYQQQQQPADEDNVTSSSDSSTESLIIKSICINPTNKYQLLSFHLGGRVCLWDYEDGLLLKVASLFVFFQFSKRRIKDIRFVVVCLEKIQYS